MLMLAHLNFGGCSSAELLYRLLRLVHKITGTDNGLMRSNWVDSSVLRVLAGLTFPDHTMLDFLLNNFQAVFVS